MGTPGGALNLVGRRRNLLRTGLIAVGVGTWLTAFNEGDQIVHGEIGGLLFLKVMLNFATPFVVANLGLMAGSDKPGRDS